MKKTYQYQVGKKTIRKEYTYIPLRYLLAGLISVAEILLIIGLVVAFCYYFRFFFLLCYILQLGTVLHIISSDDNPDYKVPWLVVVILLPIVGFMLYAMFYSRKLKKKYIRHLAQLKKYDYEKDSSAPKQALEKENPLVASHGRMLTSAAGAHLFFAQKQTYFPSGEEMRKYMMQDLQSAQTFIFLEYFIVEAGEFWNGILDVLKEKAKNGVTVRLLYDDIGCMTTLPGSYAKTLAKYGIEACPFSRLRGSANSEFNNRSHRKILVVDGKIGYTGGVNLADEYINQRPRFGHWKDTGIRIEGESIWEMTRLFLFDWGMNQKTLPNDPFPLYPESKTDVSPGYMIPFGDGPRPLFSQRVSKSVIQNMLGCAKESMYMTTPYLIIDNDLCTDIENTALRGVDVRIILPHIPDKKLVFEISRSYYERLMRAGVKIYEYTPGFLHAKSYLVDGNYALVGTVNLDYRSLVHHFENGVWMYGCSAIKDLAADIEDTLSKSIEITPAMLKTNVFTRFIRSVVRFFAPML